MSKESARPGEGGGGNKHTYPVVWIVDVVFEFDFSLSSESPSTRVREASLYS